MVLWTSLILWFTKRNCALRELVESKESVSGSGKLRTDALGVGVGRLYHPGVWAGKFPSPNKGSESRGCRAPPEVGCVEGGTRVLLTTSREIMTQPCRSPIRSPVKKMKVLMSKEGPRKDAPPAVTPRKATPLGAPRKEGSSRQRDKVVSWPRYMRDLCKVRAQSYNEPFLTWEMTDLRSCLGSACSKLAGLR
ncbi:hypothetical protein BHM03_00038931 [Ensete ventricosum]|nr:hypothetical protein BHM03_00038931 [Ensete ventricosum]